MRKLITLLLFGLTLMALPGQAQDVDESYVFLDEEGNILEDGTTVLRNVVETYDETSEVIYSGISVLNLAGSSNDFLKMYYTIERIDNGTYQICFPTTCNMKTEVGSYETGTGQLMSDLQDIQSEWFPTEDGVCIVTLEIEILSKQGLFPPTYVHKAYGPTLTLMFVKGGQPMPVVGDVNAVIEAILTGSTENPAADVNQDGEINIADVNAVIDIILS